MMGKWLRFALYSLLLWLFAAVYARYEIDLLPGLLAGLLWREARGTAMVCGAVGALLMAARRETDAFALVFLLPAMLLLARYAVPRVRGTLLPVLGAAMILGYGGMLARAGAAWCFGVPVSLPWLRQGIGAALSALLLFPLLRRREAR
ncbi:MAG: hypothetical protein E7458_00775 [Ruminococcaceae bacterium]|nr:hypothetical protein [Oscillospiraceae bacterium]